MNCSANSQQASCLWKQYATYTYPIMHLICLLKLCITFVALWCIMGDVQVSYRTLARWRLFTTTTRILQFVAFFCKLRLLSFKHQRDWLSQIREQKRHELWLLYSNVVIVKMTYYVNRNRNTIIAVSVAKMSSLFKYTFFSKKFRRVAARASVRWIFAGETAWGTCATLPFSVLEVIAISTLGNTFSCRVWSCTSYACIFIMTAWMVTPTIMCASFQSLLFSGAIELEKKKNK